jgi:hypothetical protein
MIQHCVKHWERMEIGTHRDDHLSECGILEQTSGVTAAR